MRMLSALAFLVLSANPAPVCSCPPKDDTSCKNATAPVQVSGSARLGVSPSFQVKSYSARFDARNIAALCESKRSEFQTKWLETTSDAAWRTRCVVVIHAQRLTYQAAIGRGGEQSFGSSWIDSQKGTISERRIDLLVDPQGQLSALGHELTHLVIADAFPGDRPPAWANEGAAVLADSVEKQQLHQRDLTQSLHRRTAFRCADLVLMSDYPSPERIAAFYGQSASVADFLVQVGGSEKFVPFLKCASECGYDSALRETYGIEGIAELERRWREHLTGRSGSTQVARTANASSGIMSTP